LPFSELGLKMTRVTLRVTQLLINAVTGQVEIDPKTTCTIIVLTGT
jgi:hypothetical protein